MKFSPGLVGGHCIGVDPYYLTHKAQQAGYHSRVITSGRYVNDSMGFYIAKQTVKKVIAQTPKAADIGSAAILAMLQGHPQAALALSIKAAATDPGNLNWQNNMAALLTSTGFPDQAIPVLRKLKNDLPNNSTVLNNLGHAWLGLGEPDSTKKYFFLRWLPIAKCGLALMYHRPALKK